MLGRENTGAALGSGAVDADFWALILQDEEWLCGGVRRDRQRASRDPGTAIGRPSMTAAARPDRAAAWQRRTLRSHRAVADREPTRRRWRRERSPPPETRPSKDSRSE